MQREIGRIVGQEIVADEIVRLTIRASRIAAAAHPGQFVMLKTGIGFDPLLRRPFSISQVVDNESIQVVFKVLGKGTKQLADLRVGGDLDMVGPLGKGFVVEGQSPIVLVGGGMGVAPLLFLAREIGKRAKPEEIQVFLGSRTANDLKLLADDFRSLGVCLHLATDDGSFGHHGLVTDLMQKHLTAGAGCLRIASCGPYPMLKSVAAICRSRQWPCEVSLETIMACGIGACLGCAIPKAEGLGDSFAHVCTDGPVFEAEAVRWR